MVDKDKEKKGNPKEEKTFPWPWVITVLIILIIICVVYIVPYFFCQNESRFSWFDLASKAIGGIVGLAGIAFGYFYFDSKRKQDENKVRISKDLSLLNSLGVEMRECHSFMMDLLYSEFKATDKLLFQRKVDELRDYNISYQILLDSANRKNLFSPDEISILLEFHRYLDKNDVVSEQNLTAAKHKINRKACTETYRDLYGKSRLLVSIRLTEKSYK